VFVNPDACPKEIDFPAGFHRTFSHLWHVVAGDGQFFYLVIVTESRVLVRKFK
jgi:hypothetical protein